MVVGQSLDPSLREVTTANSLGRKDRTGDPDRYRRSLEAETMTVTLSILGALSSRSLAVYHPLRKRTGVCSLTKSEHRPSSDPDSTSTRPRLDLDPDMTRPDPGRDPKSSVISPTFDLDPQISPAQDPNPRAPSRHQISLEIR